MGMVLKTPPLTEIRINVPGAFRGLFYTRRYKVFWGGRGAAKSWSIARYLIYRAILKYERIGCFRELQASIRDSVHRLLSDQIHLLGLDADFKITEGSIRCLVTGSEFLFKGLRHNYQEIKSTEGITIAWVEEGQMVSNASWDVLIPTIRAQDSEIIISFNPIEESDPTYQRFVLNSPKRAIVEKVGWQDNPHFTQTQNAERLHMLRTDPDGYDHVWEGGFMRIQGSIVFAGKWEVYTGDLDPVTESKTRFHHGLDFGFAKDPTAMVRCYTVGEAPIEDLFIDQEAYAVGCEIDHTPKLLDGEMPNCGGVPSARKWPIKADSARPETISYLRRQGFNVSPAEKWTGCEEDGIAHLKAFRRIYIHQRCKHVQQEFRLYAYKVDRVTDEVLPMLVDKHNHCIDALRYSLDGYIQQRGGLSVWKKLARG